MTADPNTTPPAQFHSQSCFPPPPTIVPLATLAMDRYLANPVQLHGLTARQVFEAGAALRYDATRLRRLYLERTLERLANLRDRLRQAGRPGRRSRPGAVPGFRADEI